jgi:hypothetical protein
MDNLERRVNMFGFTIKRRFKGLHRNLQSYLSLRKQSSCSKGKSIPSVYLDIFNKEFENSTVIVGHIASGKPFVKEKVEEDA